MIYYLESNFNILSNFLFLRDDFPTIIQSSDFKIYPSLTILRLLAAKVEPVLVMSVTMSELPAYGAISVLPIDLTIENWVTPLL